MKKPQTCTAIALVTMMVASKRSFVSEKGLSKKLQHGKSEYITYYRVRMYVRTHGGKQLWLFSGWYAAGIIVGHVQKCLKHWRWRPCDISKEIWSKSLDIYVFVVIKKVDFGHMAYVHICCHRWRWTKTSLSVVVASTAILMKYECLHI
jgi:hypothetical protein